MVDAGEATPLRSTCAQCGARRDSSGATCADRFSALLALDHSRIEPWGSRHGLAFAAYTLQHPDGQGTASLDRCWLMLYRVYVHGDDRSSEDHGLRAHGSRNPDCWVVPKRPTVRATERTFGKTIADLGAFAAEDYPSQLDAWCRATLAGWGLALPQRP